jgi:hypothetical protein
MQFRLKNVGATYQRCMQFCFKGQIRRNLEVYVDDIIMKSRQSNNLITNLEETFANLILLNIKLNWKSAPLGSPGASSWGIASPCTASKQTPKRSQPSLKWGRLGVSRMYSGLWDASRPSSISCPDLENAGSPIQVVEKV